MANAGTQIYISCKTALAQFFPGKPLTPPPGCAPNDPNIDQKLAYDSYLRQQLVSLNKAGQYEVHHEKYHPQPYSVFANNRKPGEYCSTVFIIWRQRDFFINPIIEFGR